MAPSPGRMLRANAIETTGESHATAYGASDPSRAWGALAAQHLGAVEYPFGSNGLVMSNQVNGTNRYICAAIERRPAANLAAGCRAPADILAISAGLGDLAANGASGGALYPGAVQHALRAVISFGRLAAFYGAEPAGASHASIAYGGTWADSARTDCNTGTGVRTTTTGGSTLTITVPAEFPGGEIDLYFVVSNGAPVVESVVTGATRTSRLDTMGDWYDQVTAFKTNYVVQRLTGLRPGAHTITTTLRGNLGFGLWFDGWGIADPDPPNTILFTQLKAPQATLDSFLGSFAADTPTAATIDRLNGWIAALLPEFDRLSLFQQPEIILETPNSTIDGIHHNDTGHAIVAAALIDHIRRLPDRRPAPAPMAAPAALDPDWAAAAGYAAPTHTVRHGRRLELAGRAQRTGTPAPPETILTLPERHRPLNPATFAARASSGSTAAVTVNTNGTVTYDAGSVGAGGTIDLDGIAFQVDASGNNP